MRRAARVDGNHGEVVDALRAVGCSVQSLAAIGKGCPDLLVGVRGRNLLFEVKLPVGVKGGEAHSKLNEAQVAWAANWSTPVHVVRSGVEAIGVAMSEANR